MVPKPSFQLDCRGQRAEVPIPVGRAQIMRQTGNVARDRSWWKHPAGMPAWLRTLQATPEGRMRLRSVSVSLFLLTIILLFVARSS